MESRSKTPDISGAVRAPKRMASRGFTLVELLVVIGIIALLISMLMPALSKARQSARDVQCLSNLHQLGIGMQMYANQFQNWLPKPVGTAQTPHKFWSADWIYPQIYGQSVATRTDEAWVQGTIFECPAAAATDLPAASSMQYQDGYAYRSYGMSARLTQVIGDTGDARGSFKQMSIVNSPSSTCLLIDNPQPWAGTWSANVPQNSASATSTTVSNDQALALQVASLRHHGSVNVLYCDLHASAETYASIPGKGQQTQNNHQIFWRGTGQP